jgi:hypothetical protein
MLGWLEHDGIMYRQHAFHRALESVMTALDPKRVMHMPHQHA